ncbi:hypothetical protein [Stenotrophomonas sp. ATs4]|uniref:hypothetical protein n=1 Tax=Stenotrophomonas sp. ATs4 TaxID=3402766 RepID=UPI003F71CE6D
MSAVLLFAPLAANAAALSMEDTFAAYARVITQNDEDAKTALRNSLRTADPDGYPDIGDVADALYAFGNLAAGFEESTASAINARRETIHCRAVRIEEDSSARRGVVDYQCALPDVSGAFDAYRENLARSRAGDPDGDAFRTFLGIYAATLRDAPDTTYTARAEFSRLGNNGPWSSADMLFLGLNLLKELMPFSAWDERIEAEKDTHQVRTE